MCMEILLRNNICEICIRRNFTSFRWQFNEVGRQGSPHMVARCTTVCKSSSFKSPAFTHGRVQHIDCLVQFVLSLQGFIFILMLHRLSLVDGVYYSWTNNAINRLNLNASPWKIAPDLCGFASPCLDELAGGGWPPQMVNCNVWKAKKAWDLHYEDNEYCDKSMEIQKLRIINKKKIYIQNSMKGKY